jgi:hypothetical protein
VRFEIMAMRFQIVVFWAVTPCGDITIFTVKKMEAGRSSETSLCGVTTYKTSTCI